MQILNKTGHPMHFCGGTYVGNGWIVTASHCLTINMHEKHDIFVEIGSKNLYEDPQKLIEINEIHFLPFDTITYSNDIALIRLPEAYTDLPGNVGLPHNPVPVTEYSDCSIFGYGSVEFLREISAQFREAPIEIQTAEACAEALVPYAPDYNLGMFCAGGGHTDACQGDSGSGLICSGLLVGVVSYGSSCGVPGNPGVYTTVQHHMEWIEKIMKE
ncbi:serine protease 55-like [Lutzomyia longipalpis]|uniref:serine protease 55-like n=1 Tax=Lutzomyia longipalpis TaxID=7200 RepID=UPI0024836BF4|nr:serine protease 55-like [Lutzomyia longipalpis]